MLYPDFSSKIGVKNRTFAMKIRGKKRTFQVELYSAKSATYPLPPGTGGLSAHKHKLVLGAGY
ncbi:MAG: hypothetical protein LUD50_08030, partial [Clostridia bacterium]|nr:hypothetical protein [Clostridia bacterium]